MDDILAKAKAEHAKLDKDRRDVVTELGQVVDALIAARKTKPEPEQCAPTVAKRVQCLTRLLLLVRGKLAETEKEEDKKKLGEVPGTAVALEEFTLGIYSINSGQGTPKRVIDDIDIFASRAHDRYKKLKRDAKKSRKSMDEAEYETLEARLKDLRELAHKLLEDRGRHNRLSAVLRAGWSSADPGDDGNMLFSREDLTTTNEGSAFVEWETKHFLDEESPVDFSIGGKFGFMPILSIVQEQKPDTKTNTITDTTTTTTATGTTTTTVTQTETTTEVVPDDTPPSVFPFYQQGSAGT